MKRVGHRGADLIAPGNTVASFDAAVHAGVDMLEFDVLPERLDGTGTLFLAHDYGDLAERRDSVLTLQQGLDHLVETGLDLNVDLKLPGYEDRAVDALRERGIAGRALVSTTERATLERMREVAPDVELGWSVPGLKRNPFAHKALVLPALAGVQVLRRTLPRTVAAALRAGRCDAIMCHFLLVSPAMVRAVAQAGGELYAWPVDDARRIERLRGMGVAGVITNDPRLFTPA
jgi:glycerophosphoryl diester phosphodiesterase